MNYYNASGQMNLSDRIAIETGICIGESFKKTAKRLRRHPSTIAHEVKENRTFIKGNYPNGKDCSKVRHCTVKNLCECDEEACNTKCRLPHTVYATDIYSIKYTKNHRRETGRTKFCSFPTDCTAAVRISAPP